MLVLQFSVIGTSVIFLKDCCESYWRCVNNKNSVPLGLKTENTASCARTLSLILIWIWVPKSFFTLFTMTGFIDFEGKCCHISSFLTNFLITPYGNSRKASTSLLNLCHELFKNYEELFSVWQGSPILCWELGKNTTGNQIGFTDLLVKILLRVGSYSFRCWQIGICRVG